MRKGKEQQIKEDLKEWTRSKGVKKKKNEKRWTDGNVTEKDGKDKKNDTEASKKGENGKCKQETWLEKDVNKKTNM